MIQKLRYAVLLLLLISLTACTSSPNQSDDNTLPEGYSNTGMFELEQSLRIGEETGTIFGGILGIAVSADGQIYVADGENEHIRVFSPRGDSLATIGREGEGPGEFVGLGGIHDSERGLAAYDYRQVRVTHFSHEAPHEVRSTVSLESKQRSRPAGILAVTSEGFTATYSEGFGEITSSGVNLGPDRQIVRLDTAGQVIQDSLLVVPGSQTLMNKEGDRLMFAMMPFSKGPRYTVGPDGSIYYGRTDSLRIGRYSPTGEHLSTVRFPYDYVPVSEDELDSLMSDRSDWSREMLLSSDAVSTRPAFDELVTDDQGRLWIDVTDDPSSEMTPWKIIDFDEKTIREAVLPENVTIEFIRDGRVYGIHTDEYGVDEVVVYQITSVSA